MCRAVAHQVSAHLAPAWRIQPVAIVPYAAEGPIPSTMPVLRIIESDPNEPNALGWHTEDSLGRVFGDVLCAPILDNGGTIHAGANSVSQTLSHEVLETIIDRSVSTWDQRGDGVLVAREVGDPVEGDSYLSYGVSVSNFVFPQWFDSQAPAGSRFDQMKLVKEPFAMTPGGYLILMTATASADGSPVLTTTQTFGEEMPEWKRAVKQAKTSRLGRRARLRTPANGLKLFAPHLVERVRERRQGEARVVVLRRFERRRRGRQAFDPRRELAAAVLPHVVELLQRVLQIGEWLVRCVGLAHGVFLVS